MGRIVLLLSGFPFQCSIVYTGQMFLFFTNHLASCVDNTSKLYFILATDIAILNYVMLKDRMLFVGLSCKHNQHDHRRTSSHQVKYLDT